MTIGFDRDFTVPRQCGYATFLPQGWGDQDWQSDIARASPSGPERSHNIALGFP
jgi:hypothetical protein